MLKANSGKIIVKQLEKPNVSPGGIVLPGEIGKKVNSGIVINSCNDYCDGEFFPENTRVYFKLYSGYEVEYNGENFLVVSIEDILAFESDFDN